MEVVGRRLADTFGRALTVLAGVVAAMGVVLCPSPAARNEQPGYRRLVELESTRTFSVELTAALASKDARLAGRAALALGRTEDARAAGPLENATRAQDVSVRALAVYGYGLLAARYPTQSEIVVNRLQDSAPAVRVAAVDAAWRMKAARRPGADASLTPLLVMLERDPDPLVRARTATALSGWRDGPDGVGVAGRVQHALSREQNLTVRWHLAWTLRRAYAKQTGAAAIRAGLRDPDELVRIQFADLVGRRKDRAGLPLLRPLLGDPSWRVREQASEAIRVLEGRKPTEHLKVVPAAVVTPAPERPNIEPALPAPHGLGRPHRPSAADARLDLPLLPRTAALMDGPMPGPHPRVRIGTTQGTIVVRLYPEWAPLTVANFLGLVERRLLRRAALVQDRPRLRRADRRSDEYRRRRCRLHDPGRREPAGTARRRDLDGPQLHQRRASRPDPRLGRDAVLHHASRRSSTSTATSPSSARSRAASRRSAASPSATA